MKSSANRNRSNFWRLILSTALALVGVAAISAPSFAADAYFPAGLDKVALYNGTWHLSADHFDTPFSKASHEETTLRNDCFRSAGFYACNQVVNGDSVAMLVFTYDAKADTYTSHVVPASGGDGGTGKLLIKDNVWTFPWESTDNGKTTYFHVINVMTGTDAIEYRMEFSTDKEHWTLMAKGHEARVK